MEPHGLDQWEAQNCWHPLESPIWASHGSDISPDFDPIGLSHLIHNTPEIVMHPPLTSAVYPPHALNSSVDPFSRIRSSSRTRYPGVGRSNGCSQPTNAAYGGTGIQHVSHETNMYSRAPPTYAPNFVDASNAFDQASNHPERSYSFAARRVPDMGDTIPARKRPRSGPLPHETRQHIDERSPRNPLLSVPDYHPSSPTYHGLPGAGGIRETHRAGNPYCFQHFSPEQGQAAQAGGVLMPELRVGPGYQRPEFANIPLQPSEQMHGGMNFSGSPSNDSFSPHHHFSQFRWPESDLEPHLTSTEPCYYASDQAMPYPLPNLPNEGSPGHYSESIHSMYQHLRGLQAQLKEEERELRSDRLKLNNQRAALSEAWAKFWQTTQQTHVQTPPVEHPRVPSTNRSSVGDTSSRTRSTGSGSSHTEHTETYKEAMERYNSSWPSAEDVRSGSASIPWPTLTLGRGSLHARTPVSMDATQWSDADIMKWQAHIFFTRAFGLEPLISIDARTNGRTFEFMRGSAEQMRALRAQARADRVRWHPDKLKAKYGIISDERSMAVYYAASDLYKSCEEILRQGPGSQ